MNLIEFRQGSAALALMGSGAEPPYRGAVLAPSAGEGSSVETEVLVSLEGTPAQIETALGAIQRWLTEAERAANLAGADYVFLAAQVISGAAVWRSKILSGWIELLGAGADQRASGSQGLRLHLKRANYWESAEEISLAISSLANPAPTPGGVTVQNAWDSANGNWVHLAAGGLGGDLPAPCRLYYDSAYGGNGTLYTGQNLSSAPASANLCLQGEDGFAAAGGAAVTDTPDASSSGGFFARLTWSTAADMALLELPLVNTLVTQLAGWPFLPILRLANPAGAGLWCYWRVIARAPGGDNVLAESRPAYLSESARLNPGSPLHLPPWQVVQGESQDGLYLQLRCQADTSGSHTLDVDYVFLMPLEYWRQYRPVMSWMTHLRIEDDGCRGVVKSYSAMQGHTADGPGFWLWPGREQRFYFLAEGVSGGVPVNQNALVFLYARPRKRVL